MAGNLRGMLYKLRFARSPEPLDPTSAVEPDFAPVAVLGSSCPPWLDDDRTRMRRALLSGKVDSASKILARLAKSDDLSSEDIQEFRGGGAVSHDVEWAFIKALASRKNIPSTVTKEFFRAFFARPRSAAEGLSILARVTGMKLGSVSVRWHLAALMRSVEAGSEGEEEFVSKLLEMVSADEKIRSSVLNGFLQSRQAAPGWLIAQIRCGTDMLSPASTLKLVSGLKKEQMYGEALELLRNTIGRHPGHSKLLRQRLSLEIQLNSKENIADAVASQVRAISFQAYLTRIYGEFADLVPSVTHDAHVRLFPDEIAPGSRTQADVFAALAALVVEQLQQLKALRFGEERQTTALTDWGVANYASARAIAGPATNAALLLLHAALQEDGTCREALVQLARLHELREDTFRRVEVLERAAQLDDAGPLLHSSRLAALCDIGELEKAQAAAQALYPDTGINTARFVPAQDFSSIVRTSDLLKARTGVSVFTAMKPDETRKVEQPAAYEPLSIHYLRNATLLGNTCLLGEAGDALAYDTYAAAVPASGVFLGRGNAGLVYKIPEQVEKVAEPSVYFIGLKSQFNNFYHALIQNFSRIALLKKESLLEGRRFILPVATPAWAMRILGLLGLQDENIFHVDPDKLYRFDDLIVPTPARMTSLPPLEALAATRAALGVGNAPAKARGRRIFWSRQLGDAMRRPLVNETQLVELAKCRGYEVLDPAAFTPREQIDMLAETSVVVGATGAAFVNLLFAPRGINAVCVAPRQSAKSYYPILASCLGQNFTWLLGEFLPEGRHGKGYPQLPFSIDVDTFQRGLDFAEKNIDSS